MAKRIIILDRLPMNGRLAFNYVLWAEVPLARQPFYTNAGAKSVWAGASVQENADIAAGIILERAGVYQDRTPLATETIADVRAALQAAWAAFQNEVTNTDVRWSRYGTSWDGTTWTAAGA